MLQLFWLPFVCLLYALVATLNKGITIGKRVTGLAIVDEGKRFFRLKIFFREFVCQWGIFVLIPLMLLNKEFGFHFDFVELMLFYIVLNLLCLLCFKHYLIDILNCLKVAKVEKDEDKASSSSLFFALMVDITAIYIVSLLIDRFLIQFIYIDTIFVIMLVAFLYYIVSYMTTKTTFGKFFFGIKLSFAGNHRFGTILSREVFKFGLGYWLPF
jgi:uncharacterized RDD family membrane protein YckC